MRSVAKMLIAGILLPSILQVFMAQAMSVGHQTQKAITTLQGRGPTSSDFETIITTHKQMYVDKTLFIKETMDCRDEIVHITRPSNFGKTLALSTLEYFFSVRTKNPEQLFVDLDIMKPEFEQFRSSHMGKHPVIRIDFSTVKGQTFEKSFNAIQEMISKEFLRHKYAINGKDILRNMFEDILYRKADERRTASSIHWLSQWVSIHYNGTKCVILINGYDMPIQTGFLKGYHTEIVGFMRSFLHETINENAYKKKVVIAGVIPVMAEILPNCPVAFTIFDPAFSYFGFTWKEVEELVRRNNIEKKTLDRLDAMFNGYNFGGSIIFNPGAVTLFLLEDKVGGGEFDEITLLILTHDLLMGVGLYPVVALQVLLLGERMTKEASKGLGLTDIKDHEIAYWSFMLHAGYLTGNTSDNKVGALKVTLRFPNLEIHTAVGIILEQASSKSPRTTINYASFLYSMIDMDLASDRTIGGSKLTLPDYRSFIEHTLRFQWKRLELVAFNWPIPSYRRFTDVIISMDLVSIRDTIDTYLQKAGVYFKRPGQVLTPSFFAEYVVQMLQGAAIRLNTTVKSLPFTSYFSHIQPGNSYDDVIRSAKITLKKGFDLHAGLVSKKSLLKGIDLEVTVLECKEDEMPRRKSKEISLQKNKRNFTRILILYSKTDIFTCLREGEITEVRHTPDFRPMYKL